jgi:transcriptional regulator with XRE-family HTH domain
MSHLGQLFRNARREAGLTRKQVAQAAGYKNLNKGLRRLGTLEDGQTVLPDPKIVERFAAVLKVDEADILMVSSLDCQDLNRPITPYLVERMMPAVYRRHQLPEGCTVEDARSFAARMSIERERSFCLVLSRVRAVYFYPSGESCESHLVPGMSFGRRNARMLMSKRATRVSRENTEDDGWRSAVRRVAFAASAGLPMGWPQVVGNALALFLHLSYSEHLCPIADLDWGRIVLSVSLQ